MNLKGYLSAHDGHMVFAPSKLPYLAKYHLENGTMVKDWNFYFDRSFYECKDYNLLFSKAALGRCWIWQWMTNISIFCT